MSHEAIEAVFARRDLTGTEKLVALRLAEKAHADGTEAWPSVATIAADTGLAERSVQGALARLLKKGAIKRTGTHPKYRTVVYRIVMAKGARPAPPQMMHPADDAGAGDAPPQMSASTPADDGALTPQIVHPNLPRTIHEPPERLPTPKAPALRKVDLLWEAVATECGIDRSRLTDSARGALNKAVKQLRDVGAAPIEVSGRAAAYHRIYPDLPLTPNALAKHWPTLDPSLATAPRTDSRLGRTTAMLEEARHQ